MYRRILIVDDEPVIRKGISAFIDAEKEGVIVDDQYANGAEALAALEKKTFDILITDIKMPLMNGIELTEKALKLYPWIKVILISNYNDFEYVKKGLKLGAVDYLLKLTLKKDGLLAVIRQCISLLEEEQKKDSILNHYQQGAIYLNRKNVEQEIKNLIVQEQSFPRFTHLAPEWLENSYVCVYLMLDRAEEWREQHGYLFVQLLLEKWQKKFYEQVVEGAALLVTENEMLIISPYLEGKAVHAILHWKQLIEKELEISTSAGIVIKDGINSLVKGLAESRLACQRRFFKGLGGVYDLYKSDTQTGKNLNKEEYDWSPFFEMIQNGDPVSSAIEFALEHWTKEFSNPEYVQQEACNLLTRTFHLFSDTELLLTERHDHLRKAETIQQMVAVLMNQLDEVRKPIIPKQSNNDYDEQLITMALEYIASHFKENLTLQSVADTVHLSKSYFSLYFKKQTGRNFVDYLIELRIREAKRLLVQNVNRIYEVAKDSGFKDVKYFSKVFKKITGITPIEYREKHQTDKHLLF